MDTNTPQIVAGFAGTELLGRGPLRELVALGKGQLDDGETRRLALYDDDSGRVVDVDYDGSLTQVLARLDAPPEPPPAAEPRRGPGRPRLGVVSREVSLLPRHWQWLSEQRGGASATLRRLVEAAAKAQAPEARARKAIDAAHRFIWDIAGDQPDFEEATRALFAADFERLADLTLAWPAGIVEQLERYTARAGEALDPHRS